MPEDSENVKIKIRSGDNEVEIEASLSNFRQAIELVGEVVAKMPKTSGETRPAAIGGRPELSSLNLHEPAYAPMPASLAPASAPTVNIEKGDSLSDVISKFFTDQWGRSPRKLMEVREALRSYGLNYPKQSVAVALLRLAKASKIRRFKGEGGEYVYTFSTGATRVVAPAPPAVPAVGEPHPAAMEEVEQEEQLDLDAPAAN